MKHPMKQGARSCWILAGVLLLSAGCGEPSFENAGSPNSLLEDRKACAMELEQSPATRAYRQSPTAHPEYASQVFAEMDRCIERKGWKQVKSQQEQKPIREATTSQLAQTPQPGQAREAIASQVAHTGQPAPRSDPKVGNNTADDEWPEDEDEKKMIALSLQRRIYGEP
jgi:hypothetical protein